MMIEETWMQPYLAYIVNKTLPEDIVQGTKNPRWGEEEEDDAAEKDTNEGIRVFTLAKRALFISTY
jgi:hypothetical protein